MTGTIRPLLAALALLLASGAAAADITDGLTSDEALALWSEAPETIFAPGEIVLDELRFIARPLVLFADSPNDPRILQELEMIVAGMTDLMARDVIVIVDTDPAARSPLRQTLRPRGFSLVLIGKDGAIAFRRPDAQTVREISRAIDKLPDRLREIREGR